MIEERHTAVVSEDIRFIMSDWDMYGTSSERAKQIMITSKQKK